MTIACPMCQTVYPAKDTPPVPGEILTCPICKTEFPAEAPPEAVPTRIINPNTLHEQLHTMADDTPAQDDVDLDDLSPFGDPSQRPTGAIEPVSEVSEIPTSTIDARDLRDRLDEMQIEAARERAEGVERAVPNARPGDFASPTPTSGNVGIPGSRGRTLLIDVEPGEASGGKSSLELRLAALSPWALAGGGAALGALLSALVAMLLGTGGESTLYMLEMQPLLAGPAAGDGYEHVAPLPRGETLQVMGEAGTFLLVRDELGRVGYVAKEATGSSPPPVTPDVPFVGCRRAPIEASVERCQARGKEQFDACTQVCAKNDQCVRDCRERYADCLAVCEGRVPVAAEPAPPPVVEAPAPAPAMEVAPEAEIGPDARRKARRKGKGKRKRPPVQP